MPIFLELSQDKIAFLIFPCFFLLVENLYLPQESRSAVLGYTNAGNHIANPRQSKSKQNITDINFKIEGLNLNIRNCHKSVFVRANLTYVVVL